jgi:hypothetical protein
VAIIKNDNPNARKPWTVRYRDSFGRQREASFTTRREAVAFQDARSGTGQTWT